MSTILACIEDVKTHLQSIAKLNGKVLHVYTEQELMDQTKAISLPAVGVVYEGLRAVPSEGKQMGTASELVISIMMIETNGSLTGQGNSKINSIEILDTIRSKLARTKSPTGHFWKFVVEAAASPKNGVVFWVQRWTTPFLIS